VSGLDHGMCHLAPFLIDERELVKALVCKRHRGARPIGGHDADTRALSSRTTEQ